MKNPFRNHQFSIFNFQLSIILAVIAATSCRPRTIDHPETAHLDYSDTTLWFELADASGSTYCADVFYILPSCILGFTDAEGSPLVYADPYDETQRSRMIPSYRLADEIFDSCRFFAPYYRQLTLEQWIEGTDAVERNFHTSMADVADAFAYYLDHYNHGRPFFIAGFSQGAKCTVELLKQMPDSIARRMIAAYVIGYPITDTDMAQYPNIRPAHGADDTGVTICYNSATCAQGISPILSPTDVCINPVNWSTGPDTVLLSTSITTHIDSTHNIVIVRGIDSTLYYLPELDAIFPPGNLHLGELTIYHDYLQQNIATRRHTYFTK